MNKKRDVTLDIAKGIGIMLMVLGHANSPFKAFYVLFHMPLFFIISGVFTKKESYSSIKSVGNYILKRWKGLWIPFFVCNFIFLMLNNFFIDCNIYTTNELFLTGNIGNRFGLYDVYTTSKTILKVFYFFLFSTGTPMGGATWFLRALFWVSISYCFINYVLNKFLHNEKHIEIIKTIMYVCSCFIGWYFYKINFNFYHIGVMFSVIILYHFGTYYKHIVKYIKFDWRLGTICFLILSFILKIYPRTFNISENQYGNPIMLITASIAGFFMTMCVANLIKKSSLLEKCFNYLGQHTIPILCMHLISYKIITFAQILYYKNIPMYRLASFPCYITKHGWWLLYTIAGIVIPIVANYLYKIIVSKIKLKFCKESE